MRMVPQVRSPSFPLHQGCVRIGGTHLEISHALVVTSCDLSVRLSHPCDPIMTRAIDLRQCFLKCPIQRGMELTRNRRLLLLDWLSVPFSRRGLCERYLLWRSEVREVCMR